MRQIKNLVAYLQKSMILHFKIWTAAIVLLVATFVGWIFSHEAEIGTQEAAKELIQLGNNIRRHYQNRPDFWGLSTASVINQKIYPLSMLKDGKIKGFFGNEVLVGKGANGEVLMPGARGFDIIYKNLNEKQCVELVSYRFDEKFWLGIIGITLNNGEENKYFTWSDKENILPINKKTAITLCKNNNLLIWHYE